MQNIHIKVIFSGSIQKRDIFVTLLSLKAPNKFRILIMRKILLVRKKYQGINLRKTKAIKTLSDV